MAGRLFDALTGTLVLDFGSQLLCAGFLLLQLFMEHPRRFTPRTSHYIFTCTRTISLQTLPDFTAPGRYSFSKKTRVWPQKCPSAHRSLPLRREGPRIVRVILIRSPHNLMLLGPPPRA